MKLRTCSDCGLTLPSHAFTSSQARRCINCRRIRDLKKIQGMRERAYNRLEKKKEKKVGIIRLSDLKKKVQREFNRFIRERDQGEVCLACLKPSGKMDASHYASQGGSGYLRYHPDNVNNTCHTCNRFKHGNLISYRENLVKKIGEDRVKWIEQNRNKTHKYTREQLEDILLHCKENTMTASVWNGIMISSGSQQERPEIHPI